MDISKIWDAAFLSLPTELRLHIYSFIDDLAEHVHVYITPSHNQPLTPAICRTNRQIRSETIPIYAARGDFNIDISSPNMANRARIGFWLNTLADDIKWVDKINLSRVWDIEHPSRGTGHVGFFLNIKRISALHETAQDEQRQDKSELSWLCRRGTYPIAKDVRGMRLESVNLLQRFVLAILNSSTRHGKNLTRSPKGIKHISREDLEMVIDMMDVVAAHPVSLYDFDPGDNSRSARQKTWDAMQSRLRLVSGIVLADTDPGQNVSPSK